MKIKILFSSMLLALSVMPVFAESPEPSVLPVESAELFDDNQNTVPLDISVPEENSNTSRTASSVDINIQILQHDIIIGDNMTLELYNISDELVASYTEWIDGNTENVLAHFEVSEYKIGTEFKLKAVSGINYLKHYDEYAGLDGASIIIKTYGYFDDENNYIQGTEFSMCCEPRYEKKLNVYMPDSSYQSAKLIDGVAMVPVRDTAETLGLDVYYDGVYNSVVCSAGSREIIFNIGTTYTTALGHDFYAPHEPCYVENSVYVPLRTLAEAIGSTVDVYDHGDYLDILIGESELVNEQSNSAPIDNLSSSTSYLVWISKHEFKTRVYMGSQHNWKLLQEFTCAIGAPGSETITGLFKYEYRMARWDYDTYYVAPALVFHGNYAMHSTLLSYGGGEYDGTVGAKVSHGCVRLHPHDINWIDCFVPVGSTVYVTE